LSSHDSMNEIYTIAHSSKQLQFQDISYPLWNFSQTFPIPVPILEK
jgi:hypothetical protein